MGCLYLRLWVVGVVVAVVVGANLEDVDFERVDVVGMELSEVEVVRDRLQEIVQAAKDEITHLELMSSDLELKRSEVEHEAEKLKRGREYETNQVNQRELELSEIQEEIQQKEETLKLAEEEMASMQTEMEALHKKILSLNNATAWEELLASSSNLTSILDFKSQSWGNFTRSFYSKSKHLLPHAERGFERVEKLRSKIGERQTHWLVTAFLYTTLFLNFSAILYLFRTFRVTIGRLLFFADGTFALFWATVTLCYIFLFAEPLSVIKYRTENLFLILQIFLLVGYVGYVILKLIQFGMSTTAGALGEFLCVFILGHHIFSSKWLPIMMDKEVRRVFFSYLFYFGLHLGLAYTRLDHVGGMQGIYTAASLAWQNLESTMRDLGLAPPQAAQAPAKRKAPKKASAELPAGRSRKFLAHYL